MDYAHTLTGRAEESWEPLSTHLYVVAETAAALCAAFGATDWGRILGQCHDLGKGSAEFQAYLRKSHAADAEGENAGEEQSRSGRVDHSTHGARYVAGLSEEAGLLLAFCIAGHHVGLPDWDSTDDADRSTLKERLKQEREIPFVPARTKALVPPKLPEFVIEAFLKRDRQLPFTVAFFTRMVFSALIDADRTCTEAFVDGAKASERATVRPAIAALCAAIREHVRSKQDTAEKTPVNEQRTSVQQQCIAAATQQPGFFSLQVPTGGGKTLASLLFALEHAVKKGKRRVIVAIPFTSIIEQTADVYRNALGDLAELSLVEHHTSVEAELESRANKLGAENWNAPLVVTTNVQLLESLFAARTTPCRKLHNVANSVLVLDEVQTLPVELLQPTLTALRELVEHYGCSVVLCTATQPALERREEFSIGLENVRSIIADAAPLFHALRRVEVKHAGALSDADLVQRLALEQRALCIVNTRPHALELFRAMVEQASADECFHLSTLMCGAHRREVLWTIRQRMDNTDLACRVVSTQLVEAGVDLDFPAVYRAAAGIDSIAQAAGRCNREGRLPVGYTHVFETPDKRLKGFLEKARQAGSEVFALPEFRNDPLSPTAVQEYFYQLYWKHRDQWDEKRVMECFRFSANKPAFQFREAETRFRMIDDAQTPVLVPFRKPARNFIDQLQNGYIEFVPQCKLQPYLVSIPKHAHDRLVADHAVVEHSSGVSLLLRADAYDPRTGLKLIDLGLDPALWSV